MNTWCGIGRIVADPEMKYTNGGVTIAKFRLAVARRFKKEGQPEADFLNCLAFGKTAEFVEKYFRKGMKAACTGSIQRGSYKNREGQTIYTTDIVVENVEFVESLQGHEHGLSEPYGRQRHAEEQGDFMYIPDGSEGELPFE